MSREMIAYQTALEERKAVLTFAADVADQTARIAAMLHEAPKDWRFFSTEGFTNVDPASVAGGAFIDAADWPSVGYLISLHLRHVDAERRVAAAFADLTPAEQRQVLAARAC